MPKAELWRRDTSPAQTADYWTAQKDKWKTHEPLGDEIVSAVISFLEPRLLPHIREGKILDLCSGADFNAYFPSAVNASSVTAMDISEPMLALNPASEKKVGDVREGLPFDNDSFAAVTMLFGWSHLKYNPYDLFSFRMTDEAKRLYLKTLSEIKRVLLPGGVFIIVDVASQYMEETGTRDFKYGDIADLAMGQGLNNVKGGNVFYKKVSGTLFSTVEQIDFLTANKSTN